MAEADTDPTRTSSKWVLIVEEVFPAWRDRLGSSEDARDEVCALLRDPQTCSAIHKVDASGEEIPGTASHVEDPEFWQDRLLLVPDADGGAAHLAVNYPDSIYLPDGHWRGFVRRLDVERHERLYFPMTAALPPPPSKEPTSAPASPDKIIAAYQPEKRQRAARKSELVEIAIAGRFPKGIPETLPNPELVQQIMKWLVDYWRDSGIPPTVISPSQILRVSGRKK